MGSDTPADLQLCTNIHRSESDLRYSESRKPVLLQMELWEVWVWMIQNEKQKAKSRSWRQESVTCAYHALRRCSALCCWRRESVKRTRRIGYKHPTQTYIKLSSIAKYVSARHCLEGQGKSGGTNLLSNPPFPQPLFLRPQSSPPPPPSKPHSTPAPLSSHNGR